MASIAGVEVHVEGDGAEAIVMVHGWPDTYRLWDAQARFLKDRYRCIRFSLPGFEADQPRRAWSLDELAALLKQVIEQLCPGKKAILMLHDWGCLIGYQFYLRHPELVTKIVGVDIGDGASLRRSLSMRERLMVLTYQWWLALAWVIGGAPGDWMTRAMARALRCPSPQALIGSRMSYPYYMFWFGGAQAYRRHARRFNPSCPMLFIYGRRKPLMFHAKSWEDELLKTKGNAVVPFDTGHWIMTAQPERFNQVVGDWLSATGNLNAET